MLPFVREHSSTVLADLRREYGVDLLDWWRGQLSFFELCAYLNGLPAETTTGRLMRGLPEEVEGWGLEAQLLGTLVDTTRNQWAREPVDSCMPKALFDERSQPDSVPDMQPASAAAALLGAPQDFIAKHGR